MAESFGSDPEHYDRSRPRYPDALIGQVTVDSPGLNVLDVGCRTGIATRLGIRFRATSQPSTCLGSSPEPV